MKQTPISKQSSNRIPMDGKVKRTVKRTLADPATNISNLTKTTAILGIGLISVGDDLNSDMLLRNFSQILQADDTHLKSAVILAIALIYLSNPTIKVIDLLGEYTD